MTDDEFGRKLEEIHRRSMLTQEEDAYLRRKMRETREMGKTRKQAEGK